MPSRSWWQLLGGEVVTCWLQDGEIPGSNLAKTYQEFAGSNRLEIGPRYVCKRENINEITEKKTYGSENLF